MPEKATIEKARADLRAGKSPTTAAGEFVREEIEHVREGKHGARSPEQAIAIGLSKARRAGVKLQPPRKGKASTKRSAKQALLHSGKKTSAKRSRAVRAALKHEGHSAASPQALARHARTVARKRSAKSRSASAKKAARTRARE